MHDKRIVPNTRHKSAENSKWKAEQPNQMQWYVWYGQGYNIDVATCIAQNLVYWKLKFWNAYVICDVIWPIKEDTISLTRKVILSQIFYFKLTCCLPFDSTFCRSSLLFTPWFRILDTKIQYLSSNSSKHSTIFEPHNSRLLDRSL